MESEVPIGEVAAALGKGDQTEDVFHILHHAAANPDHDITMMPSDPLWQSRFKG